MAGGVDERAVEGRNGKGVEGETEKMCILAALNSGMRMDTATESTVTATRCRMPSALLSETRDPRCGSASFASSSSGAAMGLSMPMRIWIAVFSGWVVSANLDLRRS
jgi:hypothetical protein